MLHIIAGLEEENTRYANVLSLLFYSVNVFGNVANVSLLCHSIKSLSFLCCNITRKYESKVEHVTCSQPLYIFSHIVT